MYTPLKRVLQLALCALSSACSAVAVTPEHLVFTYMGSPSTTLTANWQLLGDDAETQIDDAIVYYDTVSHQGKLDAYARSTEGTVFAIEGLKDRLIARTQLTGLQPNTSYYIVVGHPKAGFSKEVKVRTIPADDSHLRFVTGGDMGISESTRTLLKNAATYSPHFAAVGGDIAYANGKLNSVSNWDKWLDYYTEEMVTADGHTIPLLLAIGNHEVNGGYNRSIKEAPFYFGFFGQDPEKSYFKRQFGKNLSLIALDTGHISTHESQVKWLDTTLKESRGVPYTCALYHVPLYPSHRDFMGHHSDEGRKHWAPVFDKYALTVAFENHDHTFKRSHFIKHGAVTEDEEGTLYLGDGCWGRDVRPIAYEQPWYLKTQGSIKHFWVVDCHSKQMFYRAVDLDNTVFDIYPENSPGAKEAYAALAAKTHIYKLPWDVVKSTGFTDNGKPWTGGESTVTINNTFDHPISIKLNAFTQGRSIFIKGLPKDSIQLKPHETTEITVTWTPKDKDGILLKKVRCSYRVSLQLHDPAHEKPIQFSGQNYLSIKKL